MKKVKSQSPILCVYSSLHDMLWTNNESTVHSYSYFFPFFYDFSWLVECI